jgi:hypothetical protein
MGVKNPEEAYNQAIKKTECIWHWTHRGTISKLPVIRQMNDAGFRMSNHFAFAGIGPNKSSNMKRIYIFFMATVLAMLGCAGEPTPPNHDLKGRLVFKDSFNRKEIGPNWRDTGGNYRIVDGKLRAQGARNKPLWLRNKLPRNAKIEFTAISLSPAVDIKVEAWGDGQSKATNLSYTATSYVFILGGWNNTKSIIARMNEHGKDRKVKTRPKGIPGKTHHFLIVRIKNQLNWVLDGEEFLDLVDSEPLEGSGHEYFGFNNWESEVLFDDLAIYAL